MQALWLKNRCIHQKRYYTYHISKYFYAKTKRKTWKYFLELLCVVVKRKDKKALEDKDQPQCKIYDSNTHKGGMLLRLTFLKIFACTCLFLYSL